VRTSRALGDWNARGSLQNSQHDVQAGEQDSHEQIFAQHVQLVKRSLNSDPKSCCWGTTEDGVIQYHFLDRALFKTVKTRQATRNACS